MWEFNNQDLFQTKDIYMLPLSLIVLLLIAYSIRRKYKGTVIAKYFIPALLIRFFFAVLYAIVVAFYYGFGDTSVYYLAVTDMRNALSYDASMWNEIFLKLKLDPTSPLYSFFLYDNGIGTNAYMLNQSNYMVPRFSLPFSLLFNNSYLAICFCLSFYSLGGCWRIFKMFSEMYPRLHKKFAISILFLPSVLFWGGSLMKDSICMGSLGFVLYGLYNIFIKHRKILSSSVIVLALGFFLFVIKPYILLCLVPSFLLWIFIQYRNRIPNRSTRIVSGVLFGAIAGVAGFVLLQTLTKSEVAAQYSSDRILQTVQDVQGSFKGEGANSNFEVQAPPTTTFGLLLLFPVGVISTLFRPFLWEVRSPLMILSALEAFGFLCLTFMLFKRIGVRRMGAASLYDPIVIFCLIYSISFAAIIGATTPNFGALVRYKIPCVSFFLIAVFIMMEKSGKFAPDIIFSKKLF